MNRRAIARQYAVEAYKECDGTKKDFRKRMRQKCAATFDPMTIILIIKVAIMLYNWWKSRNVVDPGEKPMKDEPQFDFE